MSSIITKPNQNIIDVMLSAFGTLEPGMQFLMANNESITNTPLVGAEYQIPTGLAGDESSLLYFEQNGVEIGTKGL